MQRSYIVGPGRVSKKLQIDKNLNKQNLFNSSQIWVKHGEDNVSYKTSTRIGIDYAGDYWKNRPWRFIRKTQISGTK